jgi:FAD dependent oxidoreductase TIGR03364
MSPIKSMHHADIAIIGAGIVGLAHAYHAAKSGLKVVLFDRTPQAVGASVRNFGLVWPVGQPAGPLYERAMRSRSTWLDIIREAKLWNVPSGSLHLAYHADEQAVLEEFISTFPDEDNPDHRIVRWLTPAQVTEKSQAVNMTGLHGAMWSRTEVNVDPREAIRRIPQWLAETYAGTDGVTLRFGVAVNSIALPTIETRDETWRVDRAVVCSGIDFETLYPEIYAASGITRVKLQMLRTVPQPGKWALGPSLCAGLTLTHYDAFKRCTTLPALAARIKAEMPEYVANGIHVLLSQTQLGELTIGDSHEYGLHVEPFDKEPINGLIMRYLKTFAQVPTLEIAERWHGVYAKLPGHSEFVTSPAPNVTIVNAPGGAGMTLSFGLAEELLAR